MLHTLVVLCSINCIPIKAEPLKSIAPPAFQLKQTYGIEFSPYLSPKRGKALNCSCSLITTHVTCINWILRRKNDDSEILIASGNNVLYEAHRIHVHHNIARGSSTLSFESLLFHDSGELRCQVCDLPEIFSSRTLNVISNI
ncbi:hypothetical protein ACOME3_004398 [Neoechinorhynchus agilis]